MGTPVKPAAPVPAPAVPKPAIAVAPKSAPPVMPYPVEIEIVTAEGVFMVPARRK